MNYFKELLSVLKSIDKNLKKIADCVEKDKNNKHAISTSIVKKIKEPRS